MYLHVAHNAFRAGLNIYGQDAEELALDLFLWIKSSPCRREDFTNVLTDLDLDEYLFIRHVQSRWLTLAPALERIVKNWDAVKRYFLQDLPRLAKDDGSSKTSESNERYKRTCRKLRGSNVLQIGRAHV